MPTTHPGQTTFLGLAAGAVAGNGDVGQSIATAGWFERLRRRKRD
ncbi:hypothetical protein [Curtobacterium sp. USHLN213]